MKTAMTDLELIYDWAKCGIHHNHGYNEPKLNHNLEILESVKKSIDELYQVKAVSEEKDMKIKELEEQNDYLRKRNQLLEAMTITQIITDL